MRGLELGDGACGGVMLPEVGAGDDHRSCIGAKAEPFERFLHGDHATGIGRRGRCIPGVSTSIDRSGGNMGVATGSPQPDARSSSCVGRFAKDIGVGHVRWVRVRRREACSDELVIDEQSIARPEHVGQ